MASSEVERALDAALDDQPTTEVVIPGTGEIVDVTDAASCARGLGGLRGYIAQLLEIDQRLQQIVLDDAALLGKKTLHYEGADVEIRGGRETQWDPEFIRKGLLKAGMPEERVNEIVVEKRSLQVSAANAKQAAAGSAQYRRVIEKGSTTVEKKRTVKVTVPR